MAEPLSEQAIIQLAMINNKLRDLGEQSNELNMIAQMIQVSESKNAKDNFGRLMTQQQKNQLKIEANERYNKFWADHPKPKETKAD